MYSKTVLLNLNIFHIKVKDQISETKNTLRLYQYCCETLMCIVIVKNKILQFMNKLIKKISIGNFNSIIRLRYIAIHIDILKAISPKREPYLHHFFFLFNFIKFAIFIYLPIHINITHKYKHTENFLTIGANQTKSDMKSSLDTFFASLS